MSVALITEAVILKQFELGDYDVLYICFTKELGKIPVIAKGIRRPRSTRHSMMQTGNVVRMQLSEWSERFILKEVTLRAQAFGATESSLLVSYLFHIVELLDTMLPEHEAHPELFVLTQQVLERLLAAPRQLYLRYFEIQLLKGLGYLPDNQSTLLDQLSERQRLVVSQLAQGNMTDFSTLTLGDQDHRKVTEFLHLHLEQVAERPLKSLAFFAQ